MDGGTFLALNFLLVKLPILLIALYQLRSLRFYPKPPERDAREEPPPPPRGGDRKEITRKPLPDCLVPRPLPPPVRAMREERLREPA